MKPKFFGLQMMRKHARQILYQVIPALLGIVLGANVLVYAFWVRGGQNEIEALQTAYLKERTAAPKKENPVVQRLLIAREDIKSFRELLYSDVQFSNQIALLKEIIGKHGFHVDKLSFAPEKIEALALLKYSSQFTISGSYASLKQLLADIQNLRDIYCIEKLSFTNKSIETEFVDLTLVVSMYFTTEAGPSS